MKKMKMYKVALFFKPKGKVTQTSSPIYTSSQEKAIAMYKKQVILKPEQKKDFKFIAFRAD